MRQKPLFPSMEKEILDDRKAARREEVQRARDYLRNRDLTWLIDFLLENGPQTEHQVLIAGSTADSLFDLIALWMVKKLWRRSVGIHPGSGEESFLYGIRKVHPVPEIMIKHLNMADVLVRTITQ